MNVFTALLDGFTAVTAPSTCISCDLPTAQVPTSSLRHDISQQHHDSLPHFFCEGCLPLIEPSTRGSAGFTYGGPIAQAISHFKYKDRPELARVFRSLLRNKTLDHIGRVDAVVPVPLHWKKLFERGYNQSALLAKEIAKDLSCKVHLHVLKRVRPTLVQASLDKTLRTQNVSGAFQIKKKAIPQRVLLIDDVITTGATLNECSRILYEGGASEVRTLAIAQTE